MWEHAETRRPVLLIRRSQVRILPGALLKMSILQVKTAREASICFQQQHFSHQPDTNPLSDLEIAQ
jgi:hypothetical protein